MRPRARRARARPRLRRRGRGRRHDRAFRVRALRRQGGAPADADRQRERPAAARPGRASRRRDDEPDRRRGPRRARSPGNRRRREREPRPGSPAARPARRVPRRARLRRGDGRARRRRPGPPGGGRDRRVAATTACTDTSRAAWSSWRSHRAPACAHRSGRPTRTGSPWPRSTAHPATRPAPRGESATWTRPRLREEAVAKAARTRNAQEAPPAKYRAVLEPYAIAELLYYCAFDTFNGLALLEERSYFAGRIGERAFDPKVTLVDDALDPGNLPTRSTTRARRSSASRWSRRA